jgi:hypothetical protein
LRDTLILRNFMLKEKETKTHRQRERDKWA